ncbi:MAG: sulfite exporter TauE/SafE family protein [Deltaproteobacteria bacterium]|nr:sulfite exporter TauE/SafE family protein [Deltaproteobacteria bacterium]
MSFLAAAGICLAALLVAAMVLMSGFGLGTLLTPLFVLFYDIKIAVLLVAIVHFSNNLFKLGLFFRHLDMAILKRFGALSIVGALVGSLLQAWFQSGTLKIGLGILLVILGAVEFLPSHFSWRILVATATIIACLIDVTRIPIYLLNYRHAVVTAWPYLIATILSAFVGTLVGKWLLDIVTLGAFRRVVAGSVVVVGIAMATALI